MWVYDNEIASTMGEIVDGGLVEVHDFDGYFMGIGYINRRSKITVRMMSRRTREIDRAFIEQRVRACVDYRKHTVDMISCRALSLINFPMCWLSNRWHSELTALSR